MKATGGVPHDFKALIEEIRQRIDPIELINGYVALKRSGNNYKGLCPFHTEKTPSFMVSREKGLWHCYGCGAGGDVFSFVQKIDALTFMEAAERLAKRVGVPFDWANKGQGGTSNDGRERLRRLNEMARDFYRECLSRNRAAQEYLRDRGISEATIETFQLGYAPEGWDTLTHALTRKGIPLQELIQAGLALPGRDGGAYDRFRHRLIFPICDLEGRIIAFGGRAMGQVQPKYLNTSETAVFVKNRTLYSLHLARKAIAEAGYALIVEGYVDAIACHQWGFRNTIATMGTAVTAGHLNMLSRLSHRVVLAFDSDSAGMAAALRSIPLFEEAGFGVRVLTLPKGEDPDEVLRERGREFFGQILAEARPVVEHRLSQAASKYDLTSEDDRYALLKDAVQILAEVHDPTDRQVYAARAAEMCFHPDMRMVRWMEDAIRAELLNRGRGMMRATPTAATPVPVPAARLSRQEKAEQGLLRTMLNNPDARDQILQEVSSEEFTNPMHRQIAERIEELHDEGQTIEAPAILEGLDEKAAAFVTKLLLDEEDSPSAVEYIQALRWESMVRREQELKAAIAKGTISPEETAEYMRLTELLHVKRFGKTSI